MVFFKKTGQSKSFERMTAHVQYICFRSKELDKPIIFDRDNDNADYKKFLTNQQEKPGLEHSKTVKAHHLVFSLKDHQYEALEKDYKDVIRETLAAYEKEHHVKLDYLASVHLVDGKGKSNHPHIHVVVSGIGETDTGNSKRIYFNKDDLNEMRETFDRTYRNSIDPTRNANHRLIESLGKEINKLLNPRPKGQNNDKNKERDRTKERDRINDKDKIKMDDLKRERER